MRNSPVFVVLADYNASLIGFASFLHLLF